MAERIRLWRTVSEAQIQFPAQDVGKEPARDIFDGGHGTKRDHDASSNVFLKHLSGLIWLELLFCVTVWFLQVLLLRRP